MRRHSFALDSQVINEEMLGKFDAVVVATNHDAFDYDMIRRKCAAHH